MRSVGVLLSAALLLAACNEDTSGPGPDQADSRLAYVVPGARPALFIEDGEGVRRQVHFTGAVDNIRGNVPSDLLPVTDAQVKAIGPVKWSPDGQSLAVVLTLAYDQSQVVIVDRDGRSARTASPNMQIILSDIAWSADGKKIAYTMSTLPHARGIDVFITDLARDSVLRVTTAEDLGIAGVELSWSADGRRLYWTDMSGSEQNGQLYNPLTTVYGYELASGGRSIEQSGLVGRATGLARGAAWVLLVRNTAYTGADYDRVLVKATSSGSEQVLVPVAERVVFAELSAGQCRAVIAVDESGNPTSPDYGYRLISTRGGSIETVLGGENEAGPVDAWFARESC